MADGEHFRRLDELGRRDRKKRVGRKVQVLAELARAGVRTPPSWVLDATHFDAVCEAVLPRKHDLRSLIRLSGTRAGDERCARAHEEMLAASPSDELLEAIEALWEELADPPHGVAVRPSLAATGGRIEMAGWQLHARVGLRGPEAIATAIVELWASAFLAWSVAAYAETKLKNASVAILVQPVTPASERGLLTRTTTTGGAVGTDEWHLGVSVDPTPGRPWSRRGQLLVPMSLGRGGEEPPPALASLREALEPDGFEQLIEVGEAAVKILGAGAVVYFAVEREQERCKVQVLNADGSPRWRPLAGGDASTTWTEVPFGGRTPEPPTRLTQSVLEDVVRGALAHALSLVRCEIDESVEPIFSWSGRTYLNLRAIVSALRDLPLLEPREVLEAIGGIDPDQLRVLAGHIGAERRSLVRMPLVGGAAARELLSLDAEVNRLERDLERSARGLADLDVGIIPSDAVGTTLASAQTLLERAAELWVRCALGQLAHAVAIRSLIARRVDDVDPDVGLALIAGGGESYAASMAQSLAGVVESFRRDEEAARSLRDPAVRHASQLPDGLARGSLGQFLARYGDSCFGSFELRQPRWREDARELMDLIALLLEVEEMGSVDERTRAARATADAELARWETELSAVERWGLRGLIDRARQLERRRVSIDRLVLRSVRAVRRVVLDVDRRLRRIDPDLAPDGPFHCSAGRLRASLRSGRPELSRVIHMRTVERAAASREAAPPLGFVGSPPRGGIPIVPTAELSGIGVSPGVVEGRVRRLEGVVPDHLEAGDVLLVPIFEAAHAPLALVCGGVIAEGGGTMSWGAEVVRELGIPGVFSATRAALVLEDGERVRVDGERGRVKRLDLARPASIRPFAAS